MDSQHHDIFEALFRVSTTVRTGALRERLEYVTVGCVEYRAAEDFRELLRGLDVLIGLVELGRIIFEIEPMNANIIIAQLRNQKAAIRQKFALPDHQDISNLSTTDQHSVRNDSLSKHTEGKSGSSANVSDVAIRQSAILNVLRQGPDTRVQLKDITDTLPDVSERTIRYDIQKLMKQGSIERVGNGGPGTYYVIK